MASNKLISLMLGCIVNIVLDPILIFGIGSFKELGITSFVISHIPRIIK